jgi:hypothetical protein
MLVQAHVQPAPTRYHCQGVKASAVITDRVPGVVSIYRLLYYKQCTYTVIHSGLSNCHDCLLTRQDCGFAEEK